MNKASQETVASLNKKVAHSPLSRIRIKFFAAVGRFKRFYHEYKLPTMASSVFLVLLLVLLIIRQFQHTSLLSLINQVTSDGKGYATLLSADKTDEFTRDDTTESTSQASTGGNSNVSNTTQSTSTPFVFSDPAVGSGSGNSSSGSNGGSTGAGGGDSTGSGTGSGTGGSTGAGGGTGTTQTFEVSLDSFIQGGTTLSCSNPSKPNKGTCSKLYSFRSNLETQNGPGTVSYSWQSNTAEGNGSGSFSAGEGSALTAVSKEVSLACSKPGSFTIQFVVLTPKLINSNTINVNHNCNEL